MVGFMAWADWGLTRSGPHLEDIIDAGMLGVVEATQKLDISRVKNVDAYVAMVVRGRMINWCARVMHRDYNIGDTIITDKLEQAMEEDVDLKMDVQNEIHKLKSREQLVISLRYFSGWQLKEIAELLKCTTPNVWYIEKQALAKLQPHLLY